MEKIKVGIIGCGNIAFTKHMPTLKKNSDRVELVAFCDIDIEKAKKAKAKFGSEDSKIFGYYKEMLNEEFNVVHICTPNLLHCDMTVDSLNAGKHVMCEKPMSITSEDAKKMVLASQKTGMLLTVGYQNRFRKDTQTLKQLISEGELGDIYFAKSHALRRRGIPNWGVFTNKKLQGGGPLIDIATHSLDLTLWMMDNYEPLYAVGTTYDYLGKNLRGEAQGTDEHWDPDSYEVEDASFGFVRFKNGASVFLESSWALNTLDQKQAMATFYGTKAGVNMEYMGNTGTDRQLLINKIVAGRPAVLNVNVIDDKPASSDLIFSYPGDELECKTWLDAIQGKGELIVKAEQSMVVTMILEAIYKSAETGKTVYFD